LYGEFSLRSRDNLRFVGMARLYLGKLPNKVLGPLTVVQFYGTLLAYLILGGSFVQVALGGVIALPSVGYVLIYFVVSALLIGLGMKLLQKIDTPLTIALLVVLVLLVVRSLGSIDLHNFLIVGGKSSFFIPYGVILFALTAFSAIPPMEEILDTNKNKLRSSIIWGGVIATIATGLLGVVVMGVSGAQTSTDALSGLAAYLGDGILLVGALFGFLAIITSHVVIAYHLKEIFSYDLRLPKVVSWLLVVGVPLLAYLVFQVSFIEVVGFVGGVLGGIMGILVGLISLKSHAVKTRDPEYCLKHDRFWAYLVIGVYSLGIIYQLSRYFS